ncbi:beta-1,4-glucuronyltransferase 1-like [Bacillus rossius redtenbacheri]|uniref:beta-1,4-glucuronyltransferase 1-like n=1 Tax=Bacillus rossius redtenbacheri TaxID=93214 RepID=UPI002FDE730A
MIQIGCRLWNLSIVSVLVLTFSNILLTIRLLHSSDCRRQDTSPPEPPRHEQSFPGTQQPCRSAPADPARSNATFQVNLKLGRWDSRHIFKDFDFAVVGEHFAALSARHAVCLATQASLERMGSLVEVAHRWEGPLSAALFAAADEYALVEAYVAFARRCYAAVRERVSFHLVYPGDRPPPVERGGGAEAAAARLDCRRPEAALQELLRARRPETARWRMRAAYPQNHMRNVARRNCQGSHVFLTDVDIIPSSGLAAGLDAFVRAHRCRDKCAYVIPTYELDERVRFPHNKTELIRLAKKGLARPFHHKVFIFNQFATNFSRWEQNAETEETTVHISHSVTNFEFLYEPFYVAPDIVPAHDERFIGYGYTRNTQVYEMFVAGWQFHVLSPVFTCHWGLQNKKGRPSWRERQNSMNRRHFEVFKAEVFARYRKDPLKMVSSKTR